MQSPRSPCLCPLQEVNAILASSKAPFLVVSKKIDLPELQGEPEEVSAEKCKLAAAAVGGAVMVEDTSLCYNALGASSHFHSLALSSTRICSLTRRFATTPSVSHVSVVCGSIAWMTLARSDVDWPHLASLTTEQCMVTDGLSSLSCHALLLLARSAVRSHVHLFRFLNRALVSGRTQSQRPTRFPLTWV